MNMGYDNEQQSCIYGPTLMEYCSADIVIWSPRMGLGNTPGVMEYGGHEVDGCNKERCLVEHFSVLALAYPSYHDYF